MTENAANDNFQCQTSSIPQSSNDRFLMTIMPPSSNDRKLTISFVLGFRLLVCGSEAGGDWCLAKQPTPAAQQEPVTRLVNRDNAFWLAQPLAHVGWSSRLREASMGTGCPLDLVLSRHVGCKQPTPGSTSPQPEPLTSLRLCLSTSRPSPQPRAASSPGVSPILPKRPWGLMWRLCCSTETLWTQAS